MSQIAIRAAFEVAIAAMTPVIATAYENVTFDEPDFATPYQQIFLMFANPYNPEMGAGYRELGYVQVNLLYPLDRGTTTAATRAKAIRDTFPKNASVTASGVIAVVSGTPAIGNGFPDNGRWNIPVKIPFYANRF